MNVFIKKNQLLEHSENPTPHIRLTKLINGNLLELKTLASFIR